MQRVRLLGLALRLAGIALIAASVAMGQGQVFLLLFIPVYAGTGLLGFPGILVVFFGFFLTSLGAAWRGVPAPTEVAPGSAPPSEGTIPTAAAVPPVKYGGVVMVGPIPIVFGSDAVIAKWMMVLGLILAVLVIVAFLILSFSTLPLR